MGSDKLSLLIVDDEPYILSALIAQLDEDYHILSANNAEDARGQLRNRTIDIVLTDQKMPKETGVEFLEWVRRNHPQAIRLLMTGYADIEDTIQAINRGHVYYFLSKPWRNEELNQLLHNAGERLALERDRDRLLLEFQQLNEELEERVTVRTRELRLTNEALEKTTQELGEANRELSQQAEEMKRLALTDPLTGLFNRRAMDGLADVELKRHIRYSNPLSLGLIDVDHFSRINTKYLHTGGDAVLKGLARLLTASVREVVDSVGRVGGEEFLIIARETDVEGARSLAERVRKTIAETPIPYLDEQIGLTISLGFAVADSDDEVDYNQMYTIAAGALHVAKKTGRNRWIVRHVRDESQED